jgi:hypothetical protein
LIPLFATGGIAAPQLPDTRLISGVGFERIAVTRENGEFSVETPRADVTLRVQGQYIRPQARTILAESSSTSVKLQVELFMPPIHQSIVITASALQPDVETLDALAAGINAGQHEGGGKSLEIRRFGWILPSARVGLMFLTWR